MEHEPAPLHMLGDPRYWTFRASGIGSLFGLRFFRFASSPCENLVMMPD